jgi:hypothetical protein
MKRNVIIVLLLTFKILLFGQTKEQRVFNVNDIQGIWQLYFNYTYPNPGDDTSYKTFHIVKEKKILTVNLSVDLYDRFSVVVTKFGFTDSYFRDEICSLHSLKDTGTVFVSMAENADFKDCRINIASIFELTPKSYLNLFSDECNYLEKVPKEVLKVLYKRGIHDKRDYINEFLDLQVCGIQAEKSFIYDTTLTKTKMYLVKDDVVTVTGEQNGLVKMEYETAKGDTIKGWIKKEDITCIQPE